MDHAQGRLSARVVGIDDAMVIVDAHTNPQIAGRCLPPMLLSPLKLDDPKERKMFAGYILALDKKIVEHGLLARESGLIQSNWVACFYDVSKGVIGTVAHLLAVAVTNAIKRNAPKVELEDSITRRVDGRSRSGIPTAIPGSPD